MRGTIPTADLEGGVDLRATLESGQSYLWRRADGAMYEDAAAPPADAWYHTVADGEVVRVRQRPDAGVLEWRSTTDADPLVRELLRLEDDLHAIRATVPEDDVLRRAWERSFGLRIVADPFFPTLVSFICSAQMRVERIYRMQNALRETYGRTRTFEGETYHAFPTPDALAGATETELRDLGLGYRAPYVLETARMVADGELTAADVQGLDYEAARERLTGFVGVGEKVADCVCLFSLSYLQAVPLDTWMRTAIEEFYPDCDRGSYAETSRAFRAALGGEYAGYTQTHLFHHLRHREE